MVVMEALLWLTMGVTFGMVTGAELSNKVQDITYQDGDTALLPCDISNSNPGDRVTLLLWYKEDRSSGGGGMGSPIYRIDARTNNQDIAIAPGTSNVQILDWVNVDLLGRNRVTFDTQLSPASLKIRNVSEADAGLYRCRVDFTTSQTRTERINLKVIVRPSKPQILDDGGSILDLYAGPYQEGNEVHLSCIVIGGKPPPRVVWYKNSQLFSEQYVREEDSITGQLVTYNNLTLLAIPRSDLYSNVTCEASNYNGSIMQKTITLDMNFLPTHLSVTEKNVPLLAGTTQTFTCSAFDSRPPALITWELDHKRIDGGKIFSPSSLDGSTSTSSLTITPSEEDTNKTITCKAENPEIRQGHGVLRESWSLDVRFPPRISLALSSMLKEQSVAEGNDVYFECTIHSNPPIDRMVEWYHNNKPLKQNQRKGIIMNSSGTNLVLQGVNKEANGNYTCRATNGVPNVGHYEESKPFHLDVKYLPVCVPEGVKVYGVAKEENVRIRCQVAANPSNLTFRWTFNNSAEIKDVDRRKFSVNNSVSLFSYKPERELDYGTLMCWSRNSIGEQQRPCVFHIIAAGRPDPVKNCTPSNVNNSAFQIHCAPGFNGGLPQNFTIEVIENETLDNVVFKGVNTDPMFSVTNLKDSTDYRVYVVPVNMKGSGQPQSPQGTLIRTLTAPQPITAEKPNSYKENKKDNINPIMVIIFGGASGFVLIVVTITLAVRVRCSRRSNLTREDSKVVVTTIADLEFREDHCNDRVPLRSSKSGLTSSCSQETGKDISEFEGSPKSVFGSGESGRMIQHEFRQQCSVDGGVSSQPMFPDINPVEQLGHHDPQQQPFLMLPPLGQVPSSQHSHNFYTIRKPPHPHHQFSKPADVAQDNNSSNNRGSDLNTCRRTNSFLSPTPESAEEFVAQYREKQKAGFMYGTLRHTRHPPPPPPQQTETYNPNITISASQFGDFTEHTCGMGHVSGPSVVPPPPMFEEGGSVNVGSKTPLITKKGGKTDKKDKMESRV